MLHVSLVLPCDFKLGTLVLLPGFNCCSKSKALVMMHVLQVFVWVLTVGFTLSFGALFSKTWRVYKIFTAAKSMERVVSDFFLFSISSPSV